MDSLVAALAVMGTVLLAWVLMSFLDSPIRAQADVQLLVTLRVRGHADTMPSALHKLKRFRRFAYFDLVIEDCGLNGKARAKAQLLAKEENILLTEHREGETDHGRSDL